EMRFKTDAIDGLEMTALRRADNITEIAEITFHRFHFGERVQRPHDKERISQPAEAVVPVAFCMRGLRNAGRECGDNGARFLIATELQRDRRTDHRILPFERQCETADPSAPIILGALLK